MADEDLELLHAPDTELDPIDEMSFDEVDGLLISEYQDWPVNDRKPPYSSRFGEYLYAHENPGAWDHYWHPTISKDAARLTLEADAELEDEVPAASRHMPGKHNQKDHGGGGKGGTAVMERPRHQHITAAEARGNSRPVSGEEFDRIADDGQAMLDQRLKNRAPAKGLDENWDSIKADSYAESQKSWGGATINARTGKPLASNADEYAITVKQKGMETISVPEKASRQEFDLAMDTAKRRFRPALENEGAHLGVFHDDENHRIDIDPVVVVGSLHEVEAIGAATHAIGGAYHFKSGDGFWPPHVAGSGSRSQDTSLGEDVRWQGPGEWHSYADEVQTPVADGVLG